MATHSHLQKDPGVIQPSQGSPASAPFPGHNGRELEEPTAPWLMMSPTPGSMALPGKQQASWGCTSPDLLVQRLQWWQGKQTSVLLGEQQVRVWEPKEPQGPWWMVCSTSGIMMLSGKQQAGTS